MEHFDHTSCVMRQSLICWVCCFVNCAVEEGDILDRAEYTTSHGIPLFAQMWRQMEEKQHLSRYKAVLASSHNGQLFWHYPVPPPFPSKPCYFFLVIRLHRPQRLHNIELGAGGIRDLTLDANRSGKKQTDDNFFYEKDDTFKFTIHVSVAQRPSSVESRINWSWATETCIVNLDANKIEPNVYVSKIVFS